MCVCARVCVCVFTRVILHTHRRIYRYIQYKHTKIICRHQRFYTYNQLQWNFEGEKSVD